MSEDKTQDDQADVTSMETVMAPAPSKSIAARLRGHFLTGIFVTAPVTITLYVAFAFFSFIDNLVRKILPAPYNGVFSGNIHIPETGIILDNVNIPGVGVIVALVFFVMVGWLASNIMGKFLIRIGEYILDRIPVIRNVYSALKQIFETISASQSSAFRDVVMLEYPLKGTWSIGFVTGGSKGEVQAKVSNDTINVFVPTTPNPTSGFLLFVPKKSVKYLDMTVEEGIKLVVSAGIITPPYKEKKKSSTKETETKKAPAKKVTAKKAPAKKKTTKKKTTKK